MLHRISPEQRLFMAVINQQLLDATDVVIEPKRITKRGKPRPETAYLNALDAAKRRRDARDDARKWLKNPVAVRSLCDLAGISYEYVLCKVAAIERNDWKPLTAHIDIHRQ